MSVIALSVRQPWAWLIVHGWKPIENRGRRTYRRGPILIHAGRMMDTEAHEDLIVGEHPASLLHDLPHELAEAYAKAFQANEVHRGGIVGKAEIVDCITNSPDPWFVGDYGWVLDKAEPVPFKPCNGQLGFFTPIYF